MPTIASVQDVLRASTALVAGVALLLLLVAPASAGAATTGFGSGHLDWGVKESFRNYIVGPIGHGSYTTAGGAAKLGDGRIRFPLLGATYDDATGAGEFTVDGSVRFQAHGRVLDTTFSNICVRLSGGGTGRLYANVSGKDRTTGAAEQRYGVALADLSGVPVPTVEGTTSTWPSIAAALSASGESAFDNYPAGEQLDPLAPLVANPGTPRPRPDGGGCVGVAPPGGGGGGGGGDDSNRPPGSGNPTSPDGKPLAGSVTAVAKAVVVKRRVARIASLRCGAAPCAVTTPGKVRIRVGGKGKRARGTFRVPVLAPKRLKAGATGKVRIRLTKPAFKALAGRRAQVKVKVTIAAEGGRTTTTAKVTLRRR